ncbi:MAG TPA: hypothetical protein VFB22_01125 [Candidatus Baltobacteraceae bacterium]|nr:hypothetical protein [Candidatus Baltobacteraceae bacterium]
MIVTRQRRRRSHPGRVVVPLLFVFALCGVLALPPVRQALSSGPLEPVWMSVSGAGSIVARPLTFAAQQQTITDRNRQIRSLDAELESERQTTAAADARVKQLQRRLADVQNEPRPTPAPALVATPPPAPFGGTSTSGAAAPATSAADDKRLAATWAAMEPERAAALVQRLPDDEVQRVFAQMDPDAAGAIMDALPPAAAARISRAAAQYRTVSDR